MGGDRLTQLNELPAPAGTAELLAWCSAASLAERMAAGRPDRSADDAIGQSAMIVASMTVTELAGALAGHPRIGERTEGGRGAPRPARRAAQVGQLVGAGAVGRERRGCADRAGAGGVQPGV